MRSYYWLFCDWEYVRIPLVGQIIAFSLSVRYNFMQNLVAVAVENCDVIVGLERIGGDYHYSTIEVVQVFG